MYYSAIKTFKCLRPTCIRCTAMDPVILKQTNYDMWWSKNLQRSNEEGWALIVNNTSANGTGRNSFGMQSLLLQVIQISVADLKWRELLPQPPRIEKGCH